MVFLFIIGMLFVLMDFIGDFMRFWMMFKLWIIKFRIILMFVFWGLKIVRWCVLMNMGLSGWLFNVSSVGLKCFIWLICIFMFFFLASCSRVLVLFMVLVRGFFINRCLFCLMICLVSLKWVVVGVMILIIFVVVIKVFRLV